MVLPSGPRKGGPKMSTGLWWRVPSRPLVLLTPWSGGGKPNDPVIARDGSILNSVYLQIQPQHLAVTCS